MPYVSKPNTVNEIWASGGIVSAPTNLKISQGWTVEIPPYQYFNWSQNRVDSFVAHVNQMGIPVWDAVTEYQAGKSYVQGSNGSIYKALTTNINFDPTSGLNTDKWVLAFDAYGSSVAVQLALTNHLTNYNTLAGISNYPQARTNLSIYSKAESDIRYAYRAGTIAQTFHVGDATLDTHAINRGQFNALLQQATETNSGILEVADQSEMNVGTADNKIVTPKKGADTYLRRANNFSDVGNLTTAKANLGILPVGATAGTVAAGDDSRIVNAVPNTRTVSAGNGLTGGGALSGNISLAVGTPSTISASSANTVGAGTHNHSFDVNSFFGDRSLGVSGYYVLPGNLCIQWGSFSRGDIVNVTNFQADLVMPMNIYQAIATSRDTSQAVSCSTGGYTTTSFQVRCWERDGTVQGGNIGWIAIGMKI